MGDERRESTHRRGAFALEKLALHLALLRHVPSDDHDLRGLAHEVGGLRGQLNAELAPVRRRGGPLEHVGTKAALRQGHHKAATRGRRRRGDQIFDPASNQLGAVPTEQRLPGGIDIED